MKHSFNPTTYVKMIIIFFLSVFCLSCQDDDTTVDCVPNLNVNAQYNLNLPTYSDLNFPNGYVVLPPDGTNGSRGVIIVNTGNGYNAYDRNAPHVCPGENTTLVVEDDIKMICPSDGAEWVLRSGQPLNDATNGRTPRTYYVSVSGNILSLEY